MSKNNAAYTNQEDLEEQYLPDFNKISNASLQKYKVINGAQSFKHLWDITESLQRTHADVF